MGPGPATRANVAPDRSPGLGSLGTQASRPQAAEGEALMLRYPTISKAWGGNPGERKSPSGRTLWCGPFAVAVLTGLGYDEAYAKVLADLRRAIMTVRRKRAERLRIKVSRANLPTTIRGVHEHDVARTLGKLGVKVKWTNLAKRDRMTLLDFTRNHTVKGRTYLVVAGNHYEVIKDGVIYHSHIDPTPIEEATSRASKSGYKLARVECWAEVKPRPAAILELAPLAEAA